MQFPGDNTIYVTTLKDKSGVCVVNELLSKYSSDMKTLKL